MNSTHSRLALLFVCSVCCACSSGPTNPDSSAPVDAGLLSDGAVTDLDVPVGDAVTLDAPSDASPDVPLNDPGLPRLKDFRVDDAQRDRVYFNSSELISGSESLGFVISDRAITGVSLNPDAPSGHYFTLDRPLSFWDNNTIRYEGGAAWQDADENLLPAFLLQYIANNIPEPEAADSRYVTRTATGGGDGTSEAEAWTWPEALANAEAGQTVWIKAGLYALPPGEYRLGNSGTVDSPIKFVGYKASIGDVDSNYYAFVDGEASPPLDSSQMPTFDGASAEDVYPLLATDVDHVIVRNVQFMRTQWPIRVASGLGWVIENCNVREPNDGGAGTGFHLYPLAFEAGVPELTSYRIKNSTVVNSELNNIFIAGRGNLIEGAKAYSDTDGGTVEQSDYLIGVQGDDNIIRNSFASTLDASGGLVHGIGIKGNESYGRGSTGLSTQYNLVEHCSYTGAGEGLYVRNEAHFNVIRDSSVRGGYEGLSIRTGASNNVFENILVQDQTIGLGGRHNKEIGAEVDITTQNNTVRNCVFDGIQYLVSIHMSDRINSGTHDVSFINNRFQNCTFNDVEYMSRGADQSHPWILSGNTIENCIWNDVRNENYGTGVPLFETMFSGFDHNGYWNSFTTNLGTDAVSVDPRLGDDLDLTDMTPEDIYNGGIDVAGLTQDMRGVDRLPGLFSIGAYERD